MRAKKSLGQHFLTSSKALSQIINAGDIGQNDTVLEIGPGKGVLTEKLLEKGSNVIAVEKDNELIGFLTTKFLLATKESRLKIINEDILDWSLNNLMPIKSYKLIANIPYYITGAIIEKFLSTNHQPSRIVLLMQREVAERILAKPVKSKSKQSILSIAVAVYGKASIIARVPAGAFVPPPKVESAILLIENINKKFFNNCDEQLFFSVIKYIFGKKRKQIQRSLTDFLQSKELAFQFLLECSINPTSRPEDLSLSDWKNLTNSIRRCGKK